MATELLDLSDDIPRLVVGDIIHDVLQDPLKHGVGGAEVGDELVDSQFLHLIVVQPDAQVGGEVEFTRHVPENTLEEGVDGLYPEEVVVVQEVRQTDARSLADDLGVESRLLLHFLQVFVGIG